MGTWETDVGDEDRREGAVGALCGSRGGRRGKSSSYELEEGASSDGEHGMSAGDDSCRLSVTCALAVEDGVRG